MVRTSSASVVSFVSLVSLVSLLVAVPAVGEEPQMYVNDSTNELLLVDLLSGATQRVGQMDIRVADIAFAPDDRLFGISARYLYEIDPLDASMRPIGAHGFGNPREGYNIDALAFAADGTLYGAGDDILIRLDTATGRGTRVGELSGYRSAGDLTFDARGRLLLTTDTGWLVNVARDGGGAVPIGSIPHDDVYASATTDIGLVFGVRANNDILSLDVDTGRATVVGHLRSDDPLGSAWGGAFRGQFVPEPMTLTFMVLGVILSAGRLSRRRP